LLGKNRAEFLVRKPSKIDIVILLLPVINIEAPHKVMEKYAKYFGNLKTKRCRASREIILERRKKLFSNTKNLNAARGVLSICVSVISCF